MPVFYLPRLSGSMDASFKVKGENTISKASGASTIKHFMVEMISVLL
jgi:hypothetical protein